MKRILFYAAAMAAMTACSEDAAVETITPEVEVEKKMMTINAGSPDSRAAVQEDWSVTWEADDAMVAVTYDGDFSKFTLTEGAGTTNGAFTGESLDAAFGLLYPYSQVGNYIKKCEFSLDITSQQEGFESSYMGADGPISPISDGESLAVNMEHLTAAIEVEMTFPGGYDEATIQSVVVKGLSSKVTFTAGNSPFASCFSDYVVSPITINDGATKIAGTTATIGFNAFETSLASDAGVTVTAYVKKSDGTVAALSESITNTTGGLISFEFGTYNTLYCDHMAQVTDLWTAHASTDAFEGDGTADSPYEISTPEQLAKIAVDVNGKTNEYWRKFFKLTSDLDLSAYEWESIGLYVARSIDSYFKGTFDGDGHTISGLYINQPETDCIGLFGQIDGATVKNLSVSGSVVGKDWVGGVVGYTNNSTTVTNCYNSGSVEGGEFVGGVAGYVAGSSSVTNCYNSGSVVGRKDIVGGVVGYNDSSSSVTNCYNSGSVEGSSGNVGGVVGWNNGSVTNCYNSGSVTGFSVGGVVGQKNGQATNCYYLEGTASQGASNMLDKYSGIKAMSATDMQDSEFLGDLNANAATTETACAWKRGTDGYPTLNFGVYQQD